MASPAPAEPKVKPTKPDEEAYKASLAQAEKEHTAAQEKLVSNICFSLLSDTLEVEGHWGECASFAPNGGMFTSHATYVVYFFISI
jgi:hypothetical protein